MGKIVKLLREVSPLNRRKSPRLELSRSLECVCSLQDDGKPVEQKGYIINVSGGGTLIATRELKLYPQTSIAVRVALPSQEIVELTGVIIRTYRRNDGSAWYFSAVRFEPGNDLSLKRLLHMVSTDR